MSGSKEEELQLLHFYLCLFGTANQLSSITSTNFVRTLNINLRQQTSFIKNIYLNKVHGLSSAASVCECVTLIKLFLDVVLVRLVATDPVQTLRRQTCKTERHTTFSRSSDSLRFTEER